jgi:putative membrane protein insertion efficiency factor
MKAQNIFLSIFMYFLTMCFTSNGQQHIEQNLNLLSINESQTSYVKNKIRNPFMRFYQSFLSSQDGDNNCIFYPSCSQYAVNAVKKRGFFLGIIMAADRLTRCNPYELNYYNYNQQMLKHEDHAH